MTSLAKKDYLHVKLTGGLGNQLFGLAACFEQATRLEAGIAFDLSEYGVDNKRVFEFDYLVSSRKGEITDDYKRVFKEQNPFKFDPQVSDLLPGDLMDGYFQSYLYHEATFEKFKSWVLNEDQIFSTTMRTREIAVHIRRGDYLEKQHLSHHGICDQSYYQAGVSILRSIWGELPVVIFSDCISFSSLITAMGTFLT